MMQANDSKRRGRWCGLPLLLGLVALVAGCGRATPPEFHLNLQGRDPNDFKLVGGESAEDRKSKETRIKGRQDIVNVLYAMFGTPDEPYVFPESGLDLDKIKLAAGPTGGNEDGSQRGLYRQHCVHCHGISGDGAGPTAAFLYPFPRDYRKGIYKFKATQRSARPRAVDLENVLRHGIPGTAMPSFILLPSDEIEALAEYVRYLSIRGEVETQLELMVFDQEEALEMDRASLVDAYLKPVAESWAQAVDQVIEIADRPPVDTSEKLAASIKAGRELFRGAKAQCMKCHGPTALGDGSEERLFDDWNKDKKFADLRRQIADAKDSNERARLKRVLASWQLPEAEIQPRNLRTGIYRGGRAPADLYRRIYAGINGTPMPATGANPTTLKPEEIWQIVDYVRSLPYEALSMPLEGETTINKPQL
jgi:mono/diheme cytochrome c family protein